jgi:hypothetical protein
MLNLILSILILIITSTSHQQEEQLQISLSRTWGYSSGTGSIQGTFTIRSSGPEDLSQVIFYLDDEVLGEVNEAPFDLRFVTDDYPLGVHQIWAAGFTESGKELQSNVVEREFVSADEGWQAAGDFIIPLVVVILGAVGLATLVLFISTRGKKESLPPGAPRNYGHYGGAICPKCSRPFSRHIYGLNLATHKFDRCPYCGKWSLVRRASKEQLETAEAAEITAARNGVFSPDRSEEDELRQEIEDSRFED